MKNETHYDYNRLNQLVRPATGLPVCSDSNPSKTHCSWPMGCIPESRLCDIPAGMFNPLTDFSAEHILSQYMLLRGVPNLAQTD